jgi:RNA polymerase sigma factor (sigma-70 family)
MFELTEAGPLEALKEVFGRRHVAGRTSRAAASSGAVAAMPDAILPGMASNTQVVPDSAAPPLARTGPDALAAQEAQLRACLAAIERQDESALGQLYDATVGRVYGLALRITRSRETAEEVAEDVYMQIWRDAARFDPQRGAGVLGWLLVICRSRALDALRRVDPAGAHPAPETLAPELANEAGPETLLQAAQQNSALHAALNALSALQRQLLALAFFRGLTHEEIAGQLEMPLGTVKSHIRRALIALKEQFEAASAAPARKKVSR